MIKMGIIKKFLGKTEIPGKVFLQQQSGEAGQQGINLRLESIYGRDKIELQVLYEGWVVKENWLLRQEALPLLFGINPESDLCLLPVQLQNDIDQLWSHAQNCVEQGLLRVMNREQPAVNWRASPLDVYRWARVSRIQLPDPFTMLMEFVSKTIKQPELPQNSRDHTDNINHGYGDFDRNRERVLGIALALLAACPEKCRNSRGRVRVDELVSLINEKGGFWLGDETLDLSTTAIRDLLGKWLNTLPVSTDTNE